MTPGTSVEAIAQGLKEIDEAARRVQEATGAKDVYDIVEKNLPVGVASLKQLEDELNNPDVPFQSVIVMVDRWVSGWKQCFSRYLRIKNANEQLAAELSARKKKR